MRVAIAKAGLAGLSCAKYLTGIGHTPIVLEQGLLGGLVTGWQDKGGGWHKSESQAFGTLDVSQLKKAKRASLLKHHEVKTPRLANQTIPNRQEYCSTQQIPIHNFYLSGSYTMQPYLGSMEGAVLSGKLTAQAITAHQSAPNSLQMQNIQPATNAATA